MHLQVALAVHQDTTAGAEQQLAPLATLAGSIRIKAALYVSDVLLDQVLTEWLARQAVLAAFLECLLPDLVPATVLLVQGVIIAIKAAPLPAKLALLVNLLATLG